MERNSWGWDDLMESVRNSWSSSMSTAPRFGVAAEGNEDPPERKGPSAATRGDVPRKAATETGSVALRAANEATHVPGAARLVVKSLRDIDMAQMTLTCDLEIVIWLGVNGIADRTLRAATAGSIEHLKFRLNDREHRVSDLDPSVVGSEDGAVTITARGTFFVPFYTAAVGAALEQFPFDLVPVRLKLELGQVEPRFVVTHDLRDRLDELVAFDSDADKLPDYAIASRRTAVRFEPARDDPQRRPTAMIATVYLYRDPATVLLSVVLPLVTINFVTSLAALWDPLERNVGLNLCAAILCLAAVRRRVPPVSAVTLVDKLAASSFLMVICTGVMDARHVATRRAGFDVDRSAWYHVFLLWQALHIAAVATKCVHFYVVARPSYEGKPPLYEQLAG